jgi:beta-glucosidase
MTNAAARPRFPAGFWWGTGNSSTQCEGAAPAGDWLPWERAGHAPPSGDGNGFAARYPEDFGLLAGIGLRHFRLSLEWARLEPEEGKRDAAEIERYRAILQAGRDAGLNMWVTAHHFTLPNWFAAMGSFGDGPARTYYWRRHIEFLAETFGDVVFGWKPINEPHAYALDGWLLGDSPPGRTSMAEAGRMLVATHLASHEAWKALRGGGQPVATIHDLSPVVPASGSEADLTAAGLVEDLAFGCWIRMVRDGVLQLPALPGLPDPERIEDPDFAGAFDVIGFSYYNATSVAANPSPESTTGFAVSPYPPDAQRGPLGYVPWSDGLRLVLDRLHAELPGRPLLISEYGIGTADDAQRCQYIEEGVTIAADALARGIDLRGFFHWTGVDNYEWTHGFDVQFGLIAHDRVPRPSAEVIGRYARG